MMQLKRIGLLLLSVALCGISAQAQSLFQKLFPPQSYNASSSQDVPRTKAQLRRQNQQLRLQIDSLKNDLEQYRNESAANDSILTELRNIYEDNAGKSAAGLNPEDYTAEVTDSLLTIWYHHREISRSGEGIGYDMDSVHFESDVPDKVYIERLAAMNSFSVCRSR